MPNNNNLLFSFIIPVYNTGEFLEECLESIISQQFDLSRVEIILIDDCSTDARTQQLIAEYSNTGHYKDFPVKVIQNKKNIWLSETRNEGAKVASGKYLVCLDSDDTIESDFLILSYLAFVSQPNASWVYPSVRKFGYKNKIDIADSFSAKSLFLQNSIVAVSPLKRDLWNKLNGQRTYRLPSGVKLFEDWDFWQRALGKGKFGVPIKKVIFNYRQGIKSNISRTEEEGSLTTLLSYRNNWKSIFSLRKSQNAYKKDLDKYIDSYGFVTRLFRKVIKKTTGRNPSSFTLSDLITYVLFPSSLVKKKLKSKVKYTKAHKMAGFKSGFELDLDVELPVCEDYSNTALCTHFWWHVGGAENIMLDYMKVIYSLYPNIVDVVMDSEGSASVLNDRFGAVSSKQFALDNFAHGPYPKLLALWELIKMEKPRIILNMSNPLIYILSPLIKEKFPQTIIYDLLHCEEFDDNGWFEAAFHYQKFIDKRIVTSDFWKEILIQKYAENPDKIHVVYNMIDYEKFLNEPRNRVSKLTQYKIDSSKKIVGFLGRFHEQKLPNIFLKLAELMESNPEFHFVMAGDGPLLQELLPQIKALKNLTYIGATRNPEKIFTMYDVAIFPSKFEGYPLVGIECAQIGLPIIAANVVGFREIVNNGKAGMLYEVISEQDDALRIKNILLYHYNELIELGKNGPAFVDKFHDKTQIKADLHSLFKLD